MSTRVGHYSSSYRNSISTTSSKRSSGVSTSYSCSSHTSSYTSKRTSGLFSRNSSSRTSASVYDTNRNSTEIVQYAQYHRNSSFSSQTSSTCRVADYNVRNNSIDGIITSTNGIINSTHDLESEESFERRVEHFRTTCAALRKDMEVVEQNIERAEEGDVGSGISQSQWKEFLDAGVLIAKAAEVVREQHRNKERVNKSNFLFQYSPEGPSPFPYDVPTDTILVSIPYSPSDKLIF